MVRASARAEQRSPRRFGRETDRRTRRHASLGADVRPQGFGLVIVDRAALRSVPEEKYYTTSARFEHDRASQRHRYSGPADEPQRVRDVSVPSTAQHHGHQIPSLRRGNQDDLVRIAIEKELAREQATLYLHDRYEDDRPGSPARARALVSRAHRSRQMAEGPAGKQVMLAFLAGEADVLVTTSIIESGIDIPTANTLVVERADMLGLAQLYQIRGRIGRSDAHAYAVPAVPERGPPHRRRRRAAADAERPHRPRRRLQDRHGRPRRSAAPATCSATSRAGTSPPSASRCTRRCWRRPSTNWPASRRR